MANINKPSYIFRYHTDESGNLINVKVENNHQVSPVNNIVMLDQIPSETERLVIRGEGGQVLTECFNMDEITQSTYYCDYNEGKVYFDAIHQGKTKVISYYGRGLALISADRVFLPDSLSNGDVVDTLQDLIESGKEALESISTLGNAVLIIKKLEESIKDGGNLYNALKGLVETGVPLKESLETNIPIGQALEVKLKADITEANRIQPILHKDVVDGTNITTRLEDAIDNANDLENSMINNKVLAITSQMWGNKQSDGYHHYTWNHGLSSRALNIDVYTATSKGLEFSTVQGIIKDINNVELISEEPNELNVVISAKQYGGLISSLVAFSTDDLLEGTNNKYVQSKSYDVLANQFTLVDGLYQATLTHGLNRTLFSNKLAFVNGKEIIVGFDEISNTQIKILNTVAENVKIVLQWNGGM